ncbi:MAG TPA: hypothetical protein VK116_20180, partial [Planctomycetota bacterium]|nr:hypothetical protein [Planctomycetota bacterium]
MRNDACEEHADHSLSDPLDVVSAQGRPAKSACGLRLEDLPERQLIVALDELDADLDRRWVAGFDPLDHLVEKRIDPSLLSLARLTRREIERALDVEALCVLSIARANRVGAEASAAVEIEGLHGPTKPGPQSRRSMLRTFRICCSR